MTELTYSSIAGSSGPSDVTVVITTYNHARFLADAIGSVTAQSLKPVEIIVVDDGSADDPRSVAASFPGVRLIHQRNLGLSAARNAGLSAASGKYILFLDADDRLTPDALAINRELLERHPSWALAYGAFRLFGEGPAWQDDRPVRPCGRDPYLTLLQENCIGMHGTVLYRTDLIRNIAGFDVSLVSCEDYDVYLRLAKQHALGFSSKIIAEYRQHGSNMSSNIPLMLRGAHRVINNQLKIGNNDGEIKLASRRGLRKWFDHYASVQIGKLKNSIMSRSNIFQALSDTAKVMAFNLPWGCSLLTRKITGRRAVLVGEVGLLGRSYKALGPDRISSQFGYDRGQPIDRHYIEEFLSRNKEAISGTVLEVGDTQYTDLFGSDRVTEALVLHRHQGHPNATYFGDLAGQHNVPLGSIDCFIFTQTLHLIFDAGAAVDAIWQILKPGGVVLVTVPWISTIDHGEWGDSWYWSMTPNALRRLFEEKFGPNNVHVDHYGNALMASAFLYGLASHEVDQSYAFVDDPWCPLIVTACVRKSI